MKQSGLGDNAYIGGYDLSGDVSALTTIRGGPMALDVTGISSSAYERIGGLRDGEISFNTWFNDGALREHVALSSLPTTDTQVMYFRGTTLGNPVAAMVAKQINYDWQRNADGTLQGTVQALSNGYGLEWCRSLTAGKRTDTTATNGSSVDDSASSAFGLQAYLQVFSFAGTSVTVTIQESSDDGAGDAFAAVVGGAFTAATGITTERIATASGLTVERYLRAVTSGTFTSAVFAVAYARNATAVVF